MYNEEAENFHFSLNIGVDQVKEDKMFGACNMRERGEKYVQNFCQET
jgi:hypothetical protein